MEGLACNFGEEKMGVIDELFLDVHHTTLNM